MLPSGSLIVASIRFGSIRKAGRSKNISFKHTTALSGKRFRFKVSYAVHFLLDEELPQKSVVCPLGMLVVPHSDACVEVLLQ